MFMKGIRTFAVSSVLTVIIGILHTTGLANDPPNDAWADAYEAARAATLEAGPFSMSLYGTFAGVWIQVGALLIMLGIKNLLVVSALRADHAPRIAARLAAFDCVCFAALTGLFVYFEIPPPLISFAVLTVLFGVAARLSGRASTVNGVPAK